MQWFVELSAIWQALLASLFMYFMTALGASLVFFSKRLSSAALTVFTSMAAGIMIAASFFSLLLPALEYEGGLPPYATVTLGFLLGGAFVIVGDIVLSRVKPKCGGVGEGTALLYFAVTLHNVPEGMAVGVAFAAAAGVQEAVLSALFLAVGIAVQNFPEGLCVAVPLRARGMSRAKSFAFSQGSGAVEIPACILGAVAAMFVAGLMPWALSFSAGAMIAVVCSELIPESFSGNKTLATVGIVAGFCLMMVLDIALG